MHAGDQPFLGYIAERSNIILTVCATYSYVNKAHFSQFIPVSYWWTRIKEPSVLNSELT